MGPAEISGNDLAARAERTRALMQAGDAAVANGVAFWMDAGDELIAAKEQIPHGGWLKHLEACGIGEDKAERVMFLARHRADLNSARVRNLTIAAALRLIKQQAKHSKKPTAKSDKVKLNSLAWADASHEERRQFLEAIGLESVLEAMPPSWREPLRQRVLGLAITCAS